MRKLVVIPFLREIAIFSSNSQLLGLFRHCNSWRKASVSTCKDTSLLREVRRILLRIFFNGKAARRLFQVSISQISSRITKHFFWSWTSPSFSTISASVNFWIPSLSSLVGERSLIKISSQIRLLWHCFEIYDQVRQSKCCLILW